MSTTTSNYHLIKPSEAALYDINVQNTNMDTIDAQLKSNEDATQGAIKVSEASVTSFNKIAFVTDYPELPEEGTLYMLIIKDETSSNCFAEGTKVLTSKGLVNIEALKEGDTVTCFTSENDLIEKEIIKIVSHETDEIYRIEFDNDNYVEATWSHPFVMSNGSNKIVRYLEIGDSVQTISGELKINNIVINKNQEKYKVYDLLTESKNYLVGNDYIKVLSEESTGK